MKYIRKREAPNFLHRWIEGFVKVYGCEPQYSNFRNTPEWIDLREALLDEQGYICCYCTKRIENWDCHVEHFIPRSLQNRDPHSQNAQNIQLDYANMLLSCNGEHDMRDHCGHYKDDESSPMLLSPCQADIESHFEYRADGEIIGKDPEAMSTIRILNLNSYALKRHRDTAIYNAICTDPEVLENKDESIAFYLSKDTEGKYTPFCTCIAWAIKHLF